LEDGSGMAGRRQKKAVRCGHNDSLTWQRRGDDGEGFSPSKLETSELTSMGLPVPELVPVPLLRCPVPVLVICAFGYQHTYINVGERATNKEVGLGSESPTKDRWVQFAVDEEVPEPTAEPIKQDQRAPIKMMSTRAWSPGIYQALRLLGKSLEM
jgi:hypothetical protein